jgi:hypothetical protein
MNAEYSWRGPAARHEKTPASLGETGVRRKKPIVDQ